MFVEDIAAVCWHLFPMDYYSQYGLGAFEYLTYELAGHFWLFFVSQLGRNLIITIASACNALDWHCLIVTRHFYRGRRSWSKQDNRICFARENKNKKPRRPSEPLMFVWPGRKFVPLISSVRTRLNLWLTEQRLIIFVYFCQLRINLRVSLWSLILSLEFDETQFAINYYFSRPFLV